VNLARRIAIAWPAVVIAVLIPAAVTAAAPTHPPDPASTARAIAGDRAASSPALRSTAPAIASTHVVPWPDGPTWATARAIARHHLASFGAADRAPSFSARRQISPSDASARVAPPGPDGPTWAAAVGAGTLAAAVAAGLGLLAGRRTVRVRTD
jgi:hypothetical protein